MGRIPRVALGLSILLLAGCALPGSAVGNLEVHGSILNVAGEPLPGEPIEIVLPAEYGLGGLDRYFGEPGDYGNSDRRYAGTTDESGGFRWECGEVVYHASVWILPPLGLLPRRPSAPFLLIRFPRCGGEYYAVNTASGEFRVHSSNGEELPIKASHLIELTAEESSDDTRERTTIGHVTLRVHGQQAPSEPE